MIIVVYSLRLKQKFETVKIIKQCTGQNHFIIIMLLYYFSQRRPTLHCIVFVQDARNKM